jgi:hypothetical protein
VKVVVRIGLRSIGATTRNAALARSLGGAS